MLTNGDLPQLRGLMALLVCALYVVVGAKPIAAQRFEYEPPSAKLEAAPVARLSESRSTFTCRESSTATAAGWPSAWPSSTASSTTDRSVSLRKLPGNILQDQKDIFSFPAKLAQGKRVWPTFAVTGATAAFLASDPYSAPPFHNTTRFHDFNTAFSQSKTKVYFAAPPVVLYGVGLLRHDSYAQESALLAGEAVADVVILALPFRVIAARKQPLRYTGKGPYSDSFFNGSHDPVHPGGFYSGHAADAMAVATVLAHRYRSHRWVPYVAYGLAGAISFSRISRSEHFAGDAFFGGAMGFVISRYVVLPSRE